MVKPDLPTPQEALAILLAGNPLKANGHTIRYDEQDGVTWYTNAYGIDGALCWKAPDLNAVTTFLKDMEEGIDYGLTPD